MLDEMLQFRADALDALRQPLESGVVTIARVEGALTLPARFTLLAAFNPCPCGWRGSRSHVCVCEEAAARRYAGRLSGPLRDRIDLQIDHIIPRLLGGSENDELNWQTLCGTCNRIKGSSSATPEQIRAIRSKQRSRRNLYQAGGRSVFNSQKAPRIR